jgi:N-acylglucosamine 2-epimerase
VRHYHNPDLLEPKIYPQTRQMKSHAMAMILISVARQMRKTGEDPLYEDLIDHCLGEIFQHFMRYDEKALLETVGPNGERLDSVDGRCINPGHAIETAWFIMEEYRRRKDPELLEKSQLILDWSLERGWDQEFGGILYFVDVEGRQPEPYEHDMKLAWPHNEAIYATLLAPSFNRRGAL